jgi:ech hydrogenase subunit D
MTPENQEIIPIDVGELLSRATQFKSDGDRLVQIGCTKIEDNYEINYSFDRDFRFRNLRITVKQDTEVPSISGIYWGAFVYENEIHDLFGIPVTGMNIDFKGTFYRTSVKHPFSVTSTKVVDPCQNK